MTPAEGQPIQARAIYFILHGKPFHIGAKPMYRDTQTLSGRGDAGPDNGTLETRERDKTTRLLLIQEGFVPRVRTEKYA